MHWTVPAETLRALVPAPLELDLFQSRAYVGVVAFQMQNVRMRGWPWRVTRDFGETNVRTYVSFQGRPGVFFFSLDAGSVRAAVGGRVGWGLPYFVSSIQETCEDPLIRYSVRRSLSSARFDVAYRVKPFQEADPSGESIGLQDFLLERYVLLVVHRQKVIEGLVHHKPYPVHDVEVLQLTDTLVSSAGIHIGGLPPVAAHWSPGVDVELFALKSSRVTSR